MPLYLPDCTNIAGISIYLPNNSFQTYAEQVGAVNDDDTGFVRVDDPTKLQNMNFQIGNVRRSNLIFHDNPKSLNHPF